MCRFKIFKNKNLNKENSVKHESNKEVSIFIEKNNNREVSLESNEMLFYQSLKKKSFI